jgi:hypothetical protein
MSERFYVTMKKKKKNCHFKELIQFIPTTQSNSIRKTPSTVVFLRLFSFYVRFLYMFIYFLRLLPLYVRFIYTFVFFIRLLSLYVCFLSTFVFFICSFSLYCCPLLVITVSVIFGIEC